MIRERLELIVLPHLPHPDGAPLSGHTVEDNLRIRPFTLNEGSMDTLTQSMHESRTWASTRRAFETMRHEAHRSGWREIALEKIDERLDVKRRKAREAKARYESMASSLEGMRSVPARIETFTTYDAHLDKNVEHASRYIPAVTYDPVVKKETRKKTAALKGWMTRREKDVTSYEEKRKKYEAQNKEAIARTDMAFETMATRAVLNHPEKRARLNGHVYELKEKRHDSLDNATGYAGLATFRFTAETIGLPVVIDRITEGLKRRGLYGTISSPEFQKAQDAFIERSSVPLKEKTIAREKRVYDAKRLHTKKYLQRVLVSEDSAEGQASAASIRTSSITPGMTDAVVDIYTHVDRMQRSAKEKNVSLGGWLKQQYWSNTEFEDALRKVYHSPLIMKKGILEVTPDIMKRSSFGNGTIKRPFIGYEHTRPLMLIASLPGLKKEVLYNLPLPASAPGDKYRDIRVERAIENAVEENIANGRPVDDYHISEDVRQISGLAINPQFDVRNITLTEEEREAYLHHHVGLVQSLEDVLKTQKARELHAKAWHNNPARTISLHKDGTLSTTR